MFDQQVFDQHARQHVGRRRLVLIDGGDQVGPVELAVRCNVKARLRGGQADVAQLPGKLKQAAGFKVDKQAIETRQWCAVGLGQTQIVDGQGQAQRVEFDLADAGVAGQFVFRHPRQDALRQRVDGEITEQQIGNEQACADQKRQAKKDLFSVETHRIPGFIVDKALRIRHAATPTL